MNFERGVQRLSIFVAALGALGGGFISCLEFQTLSKQRRCAKRFEQLENSAVVIQQKKCRQTDDSKVNLNDPCILWNAAPAVGSSQDEYSTPIPPGATIGEPSTGGTEQDHAPTAVPNQRMIDSLPPGYTAKDIVPNPFYEGTLKQYGIKQVNWTNDNQIESILAIDGSFYYPDTEPSAWMYLFALSFPVVGFFVPWGLIRALIWVWKGFFEAAK